MKHGTAIRFIFDRTVVRDDDFDINRVLFRAHCSSRMITGARLTIIYEGWPEQVDAALIGQFSGPHGTTSLLDFVVSRNMDGPSPSDATVSADGSGGFVNVRGDSTFTYSMSARPHLDGARVWGFVNGVYTPDGGNHIPAVARGVGSAMADRVTRMRGLGLQKGENAPGAEDFAAVCSAVVTVTAPDIHFSGQAKTAIESRSLGLNLSKDIEKKVSLWAAAPSNADAVTAWARIALEFARTRRSVESARSRARAKSQARSLGENLSLPDKLLPSRVSGRGSGAELFICEGDSALGTIKAARDADFQAAFPLKGKPLNSYNMTLAKARVNVEFDAIERILGCGAKDRCDPEVCRYDRIMLASDADCDGYNINSLILSMFMEFFAPLVHAGMVYVTMPPLFVVTQGDTRVYCQNEDDREVAVTKLREDKPTKKVEVQRNKGLGEMNAEDFWNTVLDPSQRTLMQVTVPDSEQAAALRYTLFGGPAQGRRDWIAEMSSKVDLTTLDLGD
jgi:DNA gyrase subunit B